jgi:uncharacterized hydrophobic protein (TIGR00341 family)
LKLLEVVADAGHLDTVRGLCEHHGVRDVWWNLDTDSGRMAVRMLVPGEQRQAVLDALQALLSGSEGARILILPVEASLPRRDEDEDEAEARGRKRGAGPSREELFDTVAGGARLDSNYLLLVLLSTVVAAIGLIEDNIAVVIGAMVIAPLLGPNLALALGTALGDMDLMWSALKANLAGIGLALLLSIAIGMSWPVPLLSEELLARTEVNLDGIALALASGAAAVLSLTTGLPAVLVGVMVAVALLPPTAAMGLMIGAGRYELALGAGLLLAVNVVSVNLAAKLVLLLRGVRPRTWLERRKARQSLTIYLLV